MTKEIIRMSREELKRLKLIHSVLDRRITQREAAESLHLTERQIRNILYAVKENGDAAVIHKNRGRPSNRKYSDKFREKTVNTVRSRYHDFGPTLASEKLEALDKIRVSRETLSKWMTEAGIWRPKSKRKVDDDYSWRERKACYGEMLQTDGSIGDWFEDRGPRCVMMACIDDATGIPFARFYPAEDTRAAMDSFKKYIELNGIPKSLYFDRNSIYKVTRNPNQEEELKGKSPETQFEKVMGILDVEPIFAFSPQAKGRVERLFATFKDRLVKEMRLAGVCGIEEGNEFLKNYLPEYAERFGVKAEKPENMHREVPEDMELTWIFSFRETRVVTNDFTIRWKNRFFLLRKHSIAIKKQRVTVLENLKGEIRIWFNGRFLDFREITRDALLTKRKERKEEKLLDNIGPKKKWKPASDHPWRKQNRALFRELQK